MKCKNCKYWDRDYDGLLSEMYKPCKNPDRPRQVGRGESEHRYAGDMKCIVKQSPYV